MIFVTDISSKKIAPGQTISVFGGFFNSRVEIFFGSISASIIECEDDIVSAIVPDIIGDFDVRVSYNGKVIKIFPGVSVVPLDETASRNPAKEYTAEDFDNYIRSLFPRGIAFSMDRESNLSKLISSFAFVFAYVWETIRSLLEAIDPTHTSNFNEWEEELSLPEVGISPFGDAGRRSEIHRVECLDGGCSLNYIKHLLGLMNVRSDVYEYTKNPERFQNVDFGGDDPRFFFKIQFHLDDDFFNRFETGVSYAGCSLYDYTKIKEESVFNRIKPSHTKIVYGYDNGFNDIALSNGGYLLTDDEHSILTYRERY